MAALELVQASALIHDDVMDRPTPGGASRRCTGGSPPSTGRPVARRPGRRSATAAAILLGDLCLVWSDELLHSSGLRRRRRLPAPGRSSTRCAPRSPSASTSTCSRRPPGTPRWIGRATSPATSRPSTPWSVRCCSVRRWPTRRAEVAAAYSGLRAAAGRGVPAARRRARRLRRPGPHRQARRRRPARGQAHLPGRGRVRGGRPGRPCARSRPAWATRDLDEAGSARLREISSPSRVRWRAPSGGSPISPRRRSTALRSVSLDPEAAEVLTEPGRRAARSAPPTR